ncbi:HEAT repeat domain-containing protein [Pseudomarimonas arenosa]|uniref:HEAT repeat domain-containing protein n=1 Tax=Pseudomarimonas arenosa TaxID=2774145 RepID=A0AAW3ZNF7_9GAMM|nr:HEAT repeat domain-containing protein [Pseudomarimonas arenosa]MBD8526169.1 HEAT repeat domain-containing protein [Pseudomarimonas arenosa]
MKLILKPLAAILLSGVLSGAAIAVPNDQAMAPSGKDNQSLYWQGHESLKRSDWSEAFKQFETLEQRLRKDEPQAVDAALYWQAYSLNQAKRRKEASVVIDKLRREFPLSRWMAEADRLLEQRKPANAENGLVDAALDGLMSAPPERAIPLLKKVIEGDYPAQSKQRALFVLSQLDGGEASQMILAVAKDANNPLRREAIQMLGIGGDAEAMKALGQIYQHGDHASREAVLDAYMVAGNVDGILVAAKSIQDAELQVHAIHLLGALGASDALKDLAAHSQDRNVLGATLDAFGISGDVAALAQFSRGQADVELRAKALRNLGVAGASADLAALYPELSHPELRRAALEGLMISGDSKALSTLYGRARDDDERREILRMMTITGDDAALDLIEQAIREGEGE